MNKPYRVKTVTFQGKVGSFYLTRCVVVDEEENEFFAEVRSKELLRPNDVFFLPESCELTQDREAKIVLSHELNPLGESVVGINATGGGTYDLVESWSDNWLESPLHGQTFHAHSPLRVSPAKGLGTPQNNP